ncbi:MAG: HEAT repeat domain-containing protein [Acidobacteriota bacterium]
MLAGGFAMVLVAASTALPAAPPDLRSGTVRTIAGDLREALAGRGERWVGYDVLAIRGGAQLCCAANRPDGFHRGGRVLGRLGTQAGGLCDLDAGDWIGLDREAGGAEPFRVLLYLRDGHVDRVRTASRACTLDAGDTPVGWLPEVPAGESVALLARLVEHDLRDPEIASPALAALALHPGPEADAILAGVAGGDAPLDVRRDAMFWMGWARGRTGLEGLRAALATSGDPEIRAAIFLGLSLSDDPEAEDLLLQAARSDPDPQVRREALFHLGQRAGERVAGVIRDAFREDPDLEVKRAALFAIAQLPEGRGIPFLIDLVRSHGDPEIRREAMQWLAASGDPRALELIEAILAG